MGRKEQELEILKFWKEKKLFEKSVAQRDPKKTYVFYDGPPFATGTPHYGHILGMTSKDLFPRYWTMKGYKVPRVWGWDCHGLPVENIVEKKLGIRNKKEIEEMGVAKFNETCRSQVLGFADEWKKTVDRMGKWIDFDNSYKTMDNSYMESVWYIFKKMHDEGYLYEGKKILLYCPRCETPLANAEIAMDNSYKQVTEKTATAKFKLKNETNTYVLAWTTTPWTLIGNVALAINPTLPYLKIRVGKEFYILAKDRLSEITEPFELVEEIQGKKLLGKEYETLYSHETKKKGYYIIDGGDQVTSEDGTGIVHMAVYGEFDYEMIKKYDLPVIQHVGSHGKIIKGPEKFVGEWFKKADAKVIEDLQERNLLLHAKSYTHPYPHCYRCDTPLFYNAVDSWFVDIQKIKSKLLHNNKDINWYPEHLKDGRFKNTVESAPDWSISRNRFWATAIPVWKCTSCSHMEVIGSVKELQQKATSKVPDNVDLHKHIADTIELKCSKCKSTMRRIPEVIDCWFESGSMPYAAVHYPFENKEAFEKTYPADFISEYVAQVRTWFYYMHVMGTVLFNKAPFKNVVVTGTILAEDGSKMSKSKNNFPDPQKIFDEYGADALRFYLMNSPLMRAEDINFNETSLKDVYRKVIVITTNIRTFYELFGKDNKKLDNQSSEHILDRWIISKTNKLIKNVTHALDDYDTLKSGQEIAQFIDDLSTWYVRRSRDRFKSEDKKEREEAIQTLAFALNNLAKVMAPVTPFIAEEIYSVFKHANPKLPESVHLTDWPRFDNEIINERLEHDMNQVREVVSMALEKRESAKIPVRQALAKLTVTGLELAKEYGEIIKEELNVKEVQFKAGKEISVELDTNITKELLLEGVVREFVRKVNDYRKEQGLTIHDKITLQIQTEEPVFTEALKKHELDIKKAVQASSIKVEKTKLAKSFKILDEEVSIGIKKD